MVPPVDAGVEYADEAPFALGLIREHIVEPLVHVEGLFSEKT